MVNARASHHPYKKAYISTPQHRDTVKMVLTRAQRVVDPKKSHPGATHHTTPKKSRVLGACEYLDVKGIKGAKADVFQHFNVSKSRGWEILHQGRDRRGFTYERDHIESRRRPLKISPEDIRRLKRIIE